MTTILFSAPYMVPYVARFRPVLESYGLELLVVPVEERLNEDDLISLAGQFDGVICGDDRFSARVLNACAPRLKVISKWGTGIDSIDKGEAEKLGIQVHRTPNAFTLPVADSVLAYILAFARRQPWLDKAMKSAHWEKIPGRTLAECTLGVIGVGTIGKAIIRRARAFGMQILGNDIIEIDHVFLLENHVEMTTLDDLLRRSDFISLNPDLNPTSYHLINASTLAKMKPTGVVINTSRGPIIDEPALVDALQRRVVAGAALDVFEIEPLPLESPLLKMDNVMLAPHNANSSPLAWERVHWNTIRNLVEGFGMTFRGNDSESLGSREPGSSSSGE
jgi:D-3-phosphoglycerate dehydrogenase